MKKITRGQIFSTIFEVSDDMLARMKAAPDLANEALNEGADYWHTNILPLHFKKEAHSKYGYAQRTLLYARQKSKGSKPDLVLSGSMRSDLTKRASFESTGNSIKLKMFARVLNFVPNMAQDSVELKVNQKNGKGYPNLKREVKVMTDDEREAVAAVVARGLESRLSFHNLESVGDYSGISVGGFY